MSHFLQLHLLTFYPPSNLNRDDTGRPKTATVGGVPRLRISSQALKRAWRTSNVFHERLGEHRGQRTQRFGETIVDHLRERGVAPDRALTVAREIAQHFEKLKSERDPAPARTEQLAFISPEEWRTALSLAERIAAGEKIELSAEQLLQRADTAADIANVAACWPTIRSTGKRRSRLRTRLRRTGSQSKTIITRPLTT